MANPFKNMKLEHWPDFVLAISGVSFVMVLGALIAGAGMPGGALGWTLAFGSVVSFGMAGKVAHYRYYNKEIHKWADGWRNNTLSNIFLLICFAMLTFSVYLFYKIHNNAMHATSA